MKFCGVFFVVLLAVEQGKADDELWANGTEVPDNDVMADYKSDLAPDISKVDQYDDEGTSTLSKHKRVHEPPSHHEIIAGLHIPAPVVELEMHKFWSSFKEVHNKIYRAFHDTKRKKQWMENLIRIHQHNEDARSGHYRYFLRANHLSDLNIREYIRRMVRLTKSERDPTPPPSSTKYVKRNINVPEEWNWLEQGFITPHYDQQNCGSCYAFSIASSAQGQYFRKTRELRNLSVQQIVDCSVRNGNLGCYGGSLRNALKYCSNVGGLMSDEEYPYRARQRLCRYRPWHTSVNVSSYVILPENDEEAIKEAVATVGPVACSVDASPYTFQLYHKGIYDDPSCSSHKVNHAMLIVGYTKDAWILKNWWGEHWGIDGYMFLRKGINQCAISKYAGYPIIDEAPEFSEYRR